MLGEENFETPHRQRDLLELMQMTREERRRRLEKSVAESAPEYSPEANWIEATVQTPSDK